MNSIVIVHLFAAIVVIAAATPLAQKKVKMNRWYGVRIPSAFTSQKAWFDINQYGGRLLFVWGLTIAVIAIVGAFLEKKDWITYDWTALVIIMGGLAFVVAKIFGYARKKEKA